MTPRGGHPPTGTAQLTPREIEVMTWSARGKTYGEIATLLSIAEDTAKSHIESVRNKLNASNKTHAIAIALSNGYIKL
jgi:DNA-binding CsgD family transcriptional regulator